MFKLYQYINAHENIFLHHVHVHVSVIIRIPIQLIVIILKIISDFTSFQKKIIILRFIIRYFYLIF